MAATSAALAALGFGCVCWVWVQAADAPERTIGGASPREGFATGGELGVEEPPRFGFDGGPPERPLEGPGGPGGIGSGGPGATQQKTRLVAQFDLDASGRLEKGERAAAREYLAQRPSRGGPGGPGGRQGRGGGPARGGGSESVPAAGPKMSPADVKTFPNAEAYDPGTLRTFFLEFENADWEKELAAFHNTDVEVPAQLTVDGRAYRDVRVHFRGMSSYSMVAEGFKRSLNLSLDFAHKDQNLGGYRTFNLLNSHEDPTFLRSVLYFVIAREYVPAPKANFVRVVINGEGWGVYVSVQQFNKDLVRDWYGTTKGARWHVPGSPRGRGSLAYLGEDVSNYRPIYELKTKDDSQSWGALVLLCKTLNDTPAENLEAALAPMLDVDGALRFLALENALVNGDGYWARTSDYELYRDERGQFHLLPYDANETFSGRTGPGGPGGPGGFGGPGGPGEPGGPGGAGRRGFGGGPGGGGVELDPLVAASDATKPLISKLLAAPALRERYLGYVREIAEVWLDWNRLGPLAAEYARLIAEDVRLDTRKLDSTEEFLRGISNAPATPLPAESGAFTRHLSIQSFAEQRRTFLIRYLEGDAVVPLAGNPTSGTTGMRE